MKLFAGIPYVCGTIILAAAQMMGQASPGATQPVSQPEKMAALTPPQAGSSPQSATLAADKAPTDRLNESLPRWLAFSGEIRLRGEGFTGAGFRPDDGDGYLLTRVRLNMRIQPTSWMRFFVQGQDAHILGEDEAKVAPLPPNQDDFDLRQGYVEFGDVEKSRFGFRAGRQELAFGSQRLLGTANWLNTPRSFDGFRTTFRGNGFQVDAFAACMDKIVTRKFNKCVPGNNIYGGYGTLSKLLPHTSIEPFLFWRRQSGVKSEAGPLGVMNQATIGFHWSVKPAKGIDYDVEMARQAGSVGSDSISAWAGHWVAGYTFMNSRHKPRVFSEFDYASGDSNAADGTRATFDQIYPSGHDLYAMTDQIGLKNIEMIREGLEFTPAAKWRLTAKYGSYWLANTHDALYSGASAALARSAAGTAGRWVGQELDFVAAYNYNKRTAFSAGFGHLFPGTFLKNTTPAVGYNYPYVAITYAF